MYKLRFLAALLLVFLGVSTSSALTRDEATSVVTGAYRVTTRAFLGDVKEPGSVLTPRREGLRANRPSKEFKATVIENHQIVVTGGGDLPLTGRDGALKPGERLYLYDVRAEDDYVQLDLYTVTSYHIPGVRWSTPLQASVRFRYKGGIAGISSRQLLDDIAEWVVAEGSSGPAAKESRPAASPDKEGRTTETVHLGQTQQEVIAILGPPQKQILLGPKAIFIYPELKIIFMDGKVTDAE
ncbi:hypothetical protein [Geomonas sp.]|uniref:hypothetical protein n=1 Tax=Geomonas sp. TaxID=2651584 RepID=UPI002B45CD4F|nr:hypothetical protein [Geomonas sp.]HJV33669.1 hypothetical protein [Geomonas sp.]